MKSWRVDFGAVSEKTAAQWLSGTMMGAFAEYYRRSRRASAPLEAAVERRCSAGSALPRCAAGAGTGQGWTARLDRRGAPSWSRRSTMRAAAATLWRCGPSSPRAAIGAATTACSRCWPRGSTRRDPLRQPRRTSERTTDRRPRPLRRVQRGKVPRGPQAEVRSLLARLGVLRCDRAGADGRRHAETERPQLLFYRCPPVGDCKQRDVSAEMVERRGGRGANCGAPRRPGGQGVDQAVARARAARKAPRPGDLERRSGLRRGRGSAGGAGAADRTSRGARRCQGADDSYGSRLDATGRWRMGSAQPEAQRGLIRATGSRDDRRGRGRDRSRSSCSASRRRASASRSDAPPCALTRRSPAPRVQAESRHRPRPRRLPPRLPRRKSLPSQKGSGRRVVAPAFVARPLRVGIGDLLARAAERRPAVESSRKSSGPCEDEERGAGTSSDGGPAPRGRRGSRRQALPLAARPLVIGSLAAQPGDIGCRQQIPRPEATASLRSAGPSPKRWPAPDLFELAVR